MLMSQKKGQRYLPFLLVGIVTVIWHLILKISAGDDIVYFGTLLDGRSIWEILAHRYATWSSRMVIEFVLIPLVQVPWLWKLLDIAVYTSIPVLFYLLLNDREENMTLKWQVCLFALLYPFSDMSSAGWIATTTNYLWPLWCVLYLLLLLKKKRDGKKLRFWEGLAGIAACIYGSSQEQVAVIELVIFAMAWFYFLKRKQGKQPLLAVFCLIDIVTMISILRCPGNAIRSAQEVEGRMPQFAHFSIWEKIYMGAANVERIFLAQVNSIFLIVAIVFAALVYQKTKNYRKTLIASMPLLVLAGYSVIRTGHPWFEKIFVVPEQTAGWDFSAAETWLPMLFLLVTIAGILCALYFLFAEKMEVYGYLIVLLGVGFASGVVMGFSPTIYASSERPYLYFYQILTGVCLYCMQQERAAWKKCDTLVWKTAAGLLVAVNLAEVTWMCHII